MMKYTIGKSTREETKFINDEIRKYYLERVPYMKEPSFVSINRVMKDIKGNIIAGIMGLLYCWKCLYIDVLWIKEEYRKLGYGSILLKEIEEEAKEQGCCLLHLDTFDVQARDFYIKQGYEVFGELDNCLLKHKIYFMKKIL